MLDVSKGLRMRLSFDLNGFAPSIGAEVAEIQILISGSVERAVRTTLCTLSNAHRQQGWSWIVGDDMSGGSRSSNCR